MSQKRSFYVNQKEQIPMITTSRTNRIKTIKLDLDMFPWYSLMKLINVQLPFTLEEPVECDVQAVH